MDVVRALFCHEHAQCLICDFMRVRELFLTGEAVTALYRLNRLGRLGDAGHQVRLLASLNGSSNLDSTYLHFREVARHVLIIEGSSLGDHRSQLGG
jgi:hypothetical protein